MSHAEGVAWRMYAKALERVVLMLGDDSQLRSAMLKTNTNAGVGAAEAQLADARAVLAAINPD